MLDYKNIIVTLTIKDIKFDKHFYEALSKALEPDDKEIINNTSIKYEVGENYLTIKVQTDRKIKSVERILNDIFRCLKSSLDVLLILQ
jgi:hypothetical protein